MVNSSPALQLQGMELLLAEKLGRGTLDKPNLSLTPGHLTASSCNEMPWLTVMASWIYYQ